MADVSPATIVGEDMQSPTEFRCWIQFVGRGPVANGGSFARNLSMHDSSDETRSACHKFHFTGTDQDDLIDHVIEIVEMDNCWRIETSFDEGPQNWATVMRYDQVRLGHSESAENYTATYTTRIRRTSFSSTLCPSDEFVGEPSRSQISGGQDDSQEITAGEGLFAEWGKIA